MARTPLRRRGVARHFTDDALDAWRRCDYLGLHRALGLRPWERSPLPQSVNALGVSEDSYRGDGSAWDDSCDQAVALQKQLVAAAGWPNTNALRTEYQRNLTAAQERLEYAKWLVEHLLGGGLGSSSDPPARRKALEAAEDNLRYRQALLAELDEKPGGG